MRSIIRYLKNNWFKYGFETAAILVGILGAFALGTWHETRKEKEHEKEYLYNLLVDLEGHLDNIESQIHFENTVRENCEDILGIIEQPPYDIPELNSKYVQIGRRSFVNSSPVFEDLKYSGNLSIISESGLRHSIFKYYQHVDYVETVIANNNANYVDKMSYQLFNMTLVDIGYTKTITVGLSLDFSLDVEPFADAEDIIISQLENAEVRFTLHNMMVIRGRTSTLQAFLLDELKAGTLQLIDSLKKILE